MDLLKEYMKKYNLPYPLFKKEGYFQRQTFFIHPFQKGVLNCLIFSPFSKEILNCPIFSPFSKGILNRFTKLSPPFLKGGEGGLEQKKTL